MRDSLGGSPQLAMAYYVRAFCTSPRVPALAEIQRWLATRRSKAVLDNPNHAVEVAQGRASSSPTLDLHASDWDQIAVTYKPGKLPILAECNRDDGSEDSLLRQEIGEFLELLQEAGSDAARQRVSEHLQATRFIVACQVPTSDIEDEGLEANGEFLGFFVEHCGGMTQADGEGFYDGNKLLLPLG